VIQLDWTIETLLESWTKVVLCPVYTKGDSTNYRGIYLLNVVYKVLAKVLYDRLLLYANAVVQNYQAGFQAGKSTIDQLYALCQVLQRAIITHHLLINFKVVYDTIIRIEVFVSMPATFLQS
jgi:Reverse transcriptase (RNA-dependent DNA polymerase)